MRLTLPYKRAFKTGAVILILKKKNCPGRKKNRFDRTASKRCGSKKKMERKGKRGKGWKDNILDDTFYVFVFIACASYEVRYEKVFSYIKEEVHI